MKFEKFNYKRPNIDKLEQDLIHLLNQFKQSKDIEELSNIISKINQLRSNFESMMNLAYLQFMRNTSDSFYSAEQKFFDESNPKYQNLINEYFRNLVNCEYRNQLEEMWGKQFFSLAELQTKTISANIIEDLVMENKLVSQYTKLISSARINFLSKEMNLTQVRAYSQNKNRELRKQAVNARYGFYEEHEEELDQIFHNLVKKRTEIAQKLGYKKFVELGYARMLRIGYGSEMIRIFRKQVKDVIVPLLIELKENQRNRLNIETLLYYDLDILFDDGNPEPKGNVKWILNEFQHVFKEISPETAEFYQFMVSNNLLDVETRNDKARAGFCTYIAEYKSPYIFANFNGTSDDVRVFLHEAGHAFQLYASRNLELVDYHYPTYEACEIFSMSMELFGWKSLNRIFGEETNKYKYLHLHEALDWLVYCVAVDEFQHIVYENPELTPNERKEKWRNIEKEYLPFRNYEGNDYLEKGGYWQQQTLIYKTPFYFIDYALAQVCAFQFWKRFKANEDKAFSKFLTICKAGGSNSFLTILEESNLISPFEKGCLESILPIIKNELVNIELNLNLK
ncbi:M3 family oligoendopeptidase [Gottfriedia solisilvae]|uniref:Oligoendopeptidase F n=1 Tax=Gottfriedia solisilvae TaxID=1516104 RepID=A0A8J3ALK8_9BACI|nr:M3 family oligoendopeptidase [Gottfriedia solisilvae]GGI13127.1 oligoendopeptidase F [Gottfriedia solisilvae]